MTLPEAQRMSLGVAAQAAQLVTAEDDTDRGPFWLKEVRVSVYRGHPEGAEDTATVYVWRMEA